MQEKPHKCDECGRSFPTPGDLRAHGYSHTGNWPLRCPICNRGFCKLGALHHHMKSHGNNIIETSSSSFIIRHLPISYKYSKCIYHCFLINLVNKSIGLINNTLVKLSKKHFQTDFEFDYLINRI